MSMWTLPPLRRDDDRDAARARCRSALDAARRAPLVADRCEYVHVLTAAGMDADTGTLIGYAELDAALVDVFTDVWVAYRCAEFAYNLAAEVTGDVLRAHGDGSLAVNASDLLLFTARAYLDLISDPTGTACLPEDVVDTAWELLSVGSDAGEEVPLAAPHGPLAALAASGVAADDVLRAGLTLLSWCADRARTVAA